jgi:hypothetical protein
MNADGQPRRPPELRRMLEVARPATGAGPPDRAPEPDWDGLADTLHEIIGTAIPLLRADGVGLMLADRQGALRWVIATNTAEQALEQAQRDLVEGPCIDAFTSGQLVPTSRATPAGPGSARPPAPTGSAGSCRPRSCWTASPSAPATP